jgi:hypothetical protein
MEVTGSADLISSFPVPCATIHSSASNAMLMLRRALLLKQITKIQFKTQRSSNGDRTVWIIPGLHDTWFASLHLLDRVQNQQVLFKLSIAFALSMYDALEFGSRQRNLATGLRCARFTNTGWKILRLWKTHVAVTLRPAPVAPRRSVGVCRSQSWVETWLWMPRQQMYVKLQGVSSSCSSQHPYCRKGAGRMQSSVTGITAWTIGQSLKYIENPR